MSYSENEADDGRPGRGHDLGAVGHKVEQRGHDALCCMIKLVTQQRRQVSAEGKRDQSQSLDFLAGHRSTQMEWDIPHTSIDNQFKIPLSNPTNTPEFHFCPTALVVSWFQPSHKCFSHSS